MLKGSCLDPFLLEGEMFSDIADRVYQDVQAQHRKGNVKAGIPDVASEQLARALQKLFRSKKTVKWEDVRKLYEVL